MQQAFRFVEILPRSYTSIATYNMLITVCIQAKDLPAAMQALDLLRANGYKPDSILYNNLITGGASAMRSPGQASPLRRVDRTILSVTSERHNSLRGGTNEAPCFKASSQNLLRKHLNPLAGTKCIVDHKKQRR